VKQVLLGNGLWEQRRYNARLQPTRIGLGTSKTAGGLTPAGSGLLLLDYAYGTSSNNGNVLSQRIRVGASLNQNQAYTYDALNRLSTAAESGSGTPWSQTYAYDRYGNRRVTAGASHGSNQALTPQSTVDIAAGTNRLAGTKGVNTVGYDAAGNLTADWAGNRFKYDGDNRLVAFDAPMGTDSDTTYAYDGEGRRVHKVVGGSSGVTTTYVYNVLGQLVAEFGGTAPARPGTRYLTPDHLGSTRVVTGEDQSVLSRHDYLPFGEEIGAALGNRAQASGVSGYTASRTDGPARKFASKERDNESGLDFFGARYYGGPGGRFTSADALLVDQFEENPQSWNLYAYSRNNPLRFIDPTGRECVASGNGTIEDDGQGNPCAEPPIDTSTGSPETNTGDEEEESLDTGIDLPGYVHAIDTVVDVVSVVLIGVDIALAGPTGEGIGPAVPPPISWPVDTHRTQASRCRAVVKRQTQSDHRHRLYLSHKSADRNLPFPLRVGCISLSLPPEARLYRFFLAFYPSRNSSRKPCSSSGSGEENSRGVRWRGWWNCRLAACRKFRPKRGRGRLESPARTRAGAP